VEIRILVPFRLYTDQNRPAHKARQHDGKNWIYTENLQVLETALGEHLQFLTVSKTALDKVMPLKWSLLFCVCVCVTPCPSLTVTFFEYFNRNAV
jgi:hypothetical protein